MRTFFYALISIMSVVGVSAGFSNLERVTPADNASQLYAKNCASCHGKDGSARTFKARLNHARNLTDSDWQNRVSDERIFNSIVSGKGKMPPFGKKLSDQQIDSLVTYVRSLKK